MRFQLRARRGRRRLSVPHLAVFARQWGGQALRCPPWPPADASRRRCWRSPRPPLIAAPGRAAAPSQKPAARATDGIDLDRPRGRRAADRRQRAQPAPPSSARCGRSSRTASSPARSRRGDAATIRSQVIDLLYNHEHIVRIRVLRNGAVLADIGGADVLAPVAGTLRLGGRVVGTFEFSLQDDLGYQKLAQRLVGADTVMTYQGRTVLANIDAGATPLPQRGTVTDRPRPLPRRHARHRPLPDRARSRSRCWSRRRRRRSRRRRASRCGPTSSARSRSGSTARRSSARGSPSRARRSPPRARCRPRSTPATSPRSAARRRRCCSTRTCRGCRSSSAPASSPSRHARAAGRAGADRRHRCRRPRRRHRARVDPERQRPLCGHLLPDRGLRPDPRRHTPARRAAARSCGAAAERRAQLRRRALQRLLVRRASLFPSGTLTVYLLVRD